MCDWWEGLPVAGARLVCEAQGWAPALATGLAALVVFVLGVWAVRRRAAGLEVLGVVCAVVSAVLLAFAAGLPVLQPEGPPPPGGRIAVLIDASESVRRTGSGDLERARAVVAERLQEVTKDLPEGAAWEGSVRGFGATTRVIAGKGPAGDLPEGVRAAELGQEAGESNLAGAIDAALDDIKDGPGAGMIVMLSDGLQTRGDAAEAARRAAKIGVPIHTLGAGSNQPALGLLSYDIGPDQAIGRPATLRTTVLGAGVLNWGINGTPERPEDIEDAEAPKGVHLPVAFRERGLNFIDLSFDSGTGEARTAHAYTLVRGPARVLVYGDAPWVEQADKARLLIERKRPGDEVDLGIYDAIVIDALEPKDFAADMPERLFETAAGGTGLFLVNGPLRGSREDMQRLADWEGTVVGEVLPVNSDPALYIREPPKRDLLIIIDTSGSMGAYMDVAKAAANKVIDAVRPQDSLTIVSFASGAGVAFSAPRMPANEVQRARRAIAGLSVGGGTNMTPAINRARQLKGNNCALFIIGDGGYPPGQIQGRPICFTTAIGVANLTLPGIDATWGEQLPIRSASQLGRIEFKAFAPEPREEFWQDGPIEVIPADEGSRFTMQRPVAGVALSYPRPESSDLSIMSDPPRAPVLAFRRDPKVRSLMTGVFLGVVPAGLPGGPDGWSSTVLDELVGWDDPERFDIDLTLDGEDVGVRITPLGDGPIPAQIGVAFLMPDGSSTGLSMRGPDDFGAFVGTGRISLSNATMRGIMTLDSGDRDVQAIPVRFPARADPVPRPGSAQERFGFGVDDVLLSELRALTGGVDLSIATPDVRRGSAVLTPILIWPWLAGLAALLFAGSLFCGGVRR